MEWQDLLIDEEVKKLKEKLKNKEDGKKLGQILKRIEKCEKRPTV